jgi:hypothetical protein
MVPEDRREAVGQSGGRVSRGWMERCIWIVSMTLQRMSWKLFLLKRDRLDCYEHGKAEAAAANCLGDVVA